LTRAGTRASPHARRPQPPANPTVLRGCGRPALYRVRGVPQTRSTPEVWIELRQTGKLVDLHRLRAALEPPVELGAEDDDVRHHVQPDEQDRGGAERAQRRVQVRVALVDR